MEPNSAPLWYVTPNGAWRARVLGAAAADAVTLDADFAAAGRVKTDQVLEQRAFSQPIRRESRNLAAPQEKVMSVRSGGASP
jgi:hypothetical protein